MVRIYLENMVPSDVSNAVRKTLADLHERGYKIALAHPVEMLRLF